VNLFIGQCARQVNLFIGQMCKTGEFYHWTNNK